MWTVRADILRRGQRSFMLAVNKIDGQRQEAHVAEFYAQGPKRSMGFRRSMGGGRHLLSVVNELPADELDDSQDDEVTLPFIEKSNAGKSTLLIAIRRRAYDRGFYAGNDAGCDRCPLDG